MKRATQEPSGLPPTDGRKRVARETLASGRQVHIDRMTDAQGKVVVVVRVGGDAGWQTKTLAAWWFPFFGKPLAERIRAAIIELDNPIETEEEQDEVAQAVEVALFHGGPLQEGMRASRQEPPLIMREPPDPPPADMR